MSTINITNARQNLFQLVDDVNVGFNPITIVNSKNKKYEYKINMNILAGLFQKKYIEII